MKILPRICSILPALLIAAQAPKAQEPQPAVAAPPKLDRFGDPLPPGALLRLGTSRFRHDGGVESLAYSADGKTLTTRDSTNTLHLWEVATGKRLRKIPDVGPSFLGPTSVAYAPDGKTLAVSNEKNEIELIETATGKALATLAGHENSVLAVAYALDGRLLVSGDSTGNIRLWDCASGLELYAIEPLPDSIYALAISPDQKVLAAGTGGSGIYFWKITEGRVLKRRQMKGHAGEVGGVAFASDGMRLASASADQSMRLWDAGTGKELKRWEDFPAKLKCVAFSPNGKLLAVGDAEGKVRLGDPDAALKEWKHLKGGSEVLALSFDSGGKIVAGAEADGEVVLWAADTGKELARFKAHEGEACALKFSPSGQFFATAGEDGKVQLWDAQTRKNLQSLRPLLDKDGELPALYDLAFAPDGKSVAAACDDGAIRFWDLAKGQEFRKVLVRPEETQHCIVFSPDGRSLVSGGEEGVMIVWDAATGKELRKTRVPESANIVSLSYAADGKTLAVACDQTIHLWEEGSGMTLEPVQRSGHEYPITRVCYSPDGKWIATLDGEYSLHLWNAKDGQETMLAGAQPESCSFMAFSPSGKHLIAGTAFGNLVLWEVGSVKEYVKLNTPPGNILAVAYSPGGKELAYAVAEPEGNAKLYMRDGGSLQALRNFDCGLKHVSALAFSSDGAVLACGGTEGGICLYQASTGKQVGALYNPAEDPHVMLQGLVFSPDGKLLAERNAKGTVAIWELATHKPIQRLITNSTALAWSVNAKYLAFEGPNRQIKVQELFTGQECFALPALESVMECLAFAPDGSTLVAGCRDSTALVLSLSAGNTSKPPAAGEASRENLEDLWNRLAELEPALAYPALRKLVDAGARSVLFLQERLRAPAVDVERIRKLIAELDHEDTEVRESATKELTGLRVPAAEILQRIISSKPSLEVQARIKKIMAEPDVSTVQSPQFLRRMRALAVLEEIGNPAAKAVLAEIARQSNYAAERQDAQAALERLQR